MRRSVAVGVVLVGFVGWAGCSQKGDGPGTRSETARVSAVSASSGLAYPEYDLDVPVEFFAFEHRPASEITAKMGEGFRLISVSAATDVSPPLFNAALVRNDDPNSPYYRVGNGWASDLTESQLTAIQTDGTNRRIVDIAPYLVGGQRHYAAVWLDNTGTQQVYYQLILHATPAGFQSQAQAVVGSGPSPGWRVIDVEAMPVPGGSAGQYEVSGIAIANTDTATTRQQFFGYGPLAGNNVAAPSDPTQVQSASLGKSVSDNQGRTADLSSPFGDGNFFWVAEKTLDNSPEQLSDSNCLTFASPSTERNWWFGELQVESASDDANQEQFVSHMLTRFGARLGKVKSYKSQAAAGAVRYAGVAVDNGFPVPQGLFNDNPVLKKVDAVFMNRLKRWGLPGGALALAKNGQLIYARGYGYSKLNPLTPAQPDDLFHLASVSKPLNQALLLRLLNDDASLKPVHTLTGGPVTLDTHPFGEIFSYTPPAGITGGCAVDTAGGDATGCTLANIRIRDLIYHRSGLQNVGNPGTPFSDWLFSSDVPNQTVGLKPGGAMKPADWVKRELYWHCQETTPVPPTCGRPGPFVQPPGTLFSYMNAEYQIVLAIVEALSGESYEAYLSEALAPIGLQNKILPAYVSTSTAPAAQSQALNYTIPLPGFIPFVPEAVRAADASVYPSIWTDNRDTHDYMGSASIAASMIALVRWETAVDGSRGGYRIFGGPGVTTDPFNHDFRGGDPGCLNCATPGGTTGYPFEHGGLFNYDVQARMRMLPNGITWAFAVNGDSLWGENDLCCPGTTNCGAPPTCAPGITPVPVARFTHGNPLAGSFDGELRNDLENIFTGTGGSPGCANVLPAVDHFGDYLPADPHAVCTNVSLPAGPNCAITIDPSEVSAGSTNGTLSLSTGNTFSPGTHPTQLQVTNSLGVSRCGASVTVVDNTSPTLTVPGDVSRTICGATATVNIGQATATDNCTTNIQPIGNVISKNGVPLSPPIQVVGGQAVLGPGTYVVSWLASDGSLTVTKPQNVVVVGDTSAPTLTAPGTVNAKTCQADAVVSVGQATGTDNCPLTITGQWITSNGVTLSPPVAVNGGQLDLPVGTHTIKWTATDGVNSAPPVTQTVTLSPAIESSQSFDVQDRAQIRLPGSGYAAVLNAGSVLTHLGQNTHTGAVLSVASVTLDNGAIVEGPVTSAGTISPNSATTGVQTQHANVVLPAIPALPAFPTPTGGFDVSTGTRNQAPGSFTTVNVNGGTLVLGSGDYFFQNLTMNSNGTVRATATTRVFVLNTLNYQTSFRTATGTNVQPIYLGYAASATLNLNVRFDGTLVAPNATASLGAGAGVTFTGAFFAKKLQVIPASALVCSP